MIRIEDIDLEVDEEYYNIVKKLLFNKTVLKMKDIPMHGKCNCYEHCVKVSYYCYKICKRFHLDYEEAAIAGLLHDLFLYNWRNKKQDHRKGLHGFTHPKVACENAGKLIDLSEKEKDMILKHMWPLTVVPPKYIEGFILTYVDKKCAILENIKSLSKSKAWGYAYLFMCLLFIKR